MKTRPGGHGVIVLPLAQNWRMRSRSPMKNLYPLSPRITVHPVPSTGRMFFVQYPRQ
jgi:hypothetical protein